MEFDPAHVLGQFGPSLRDLLFVCVPPQRCRAGLSWFVPAGLDFTMVWRPACSKTADCSEVLLACIRIAVMTVTRRLWTSCARPYRL